MDDETEILFDVVERLDSASIDYMVTGSTAMAFYSLPRMTRDIDIVVQVGAEDTDRIFELFKGDYYIDRNAVHRSITGSRLFNIINYQKVVKVDLIVRKDEEFKIVEFSRRQRISYMQKMVWVVAPEDLILSKLMWARETESELQLRDVRQLMLSVKELDTEYVRNWGARLNVIGLLERAMQHV